MEFIRSFIWEGNVEKKVIVILVILFLLFTFLLCQEPEDLPRTDSQKLYLYFMGEEAGYEEYEWIEQEDRYILRAQGELTKPVSLITELMSIEMDKELRPLSFHFKGKVRGMEQEFISTISQGEVKNLIRAGGQQRETTSKITADALILPNSFFPTPLGVCMRLLKIIFSIQSSSSEESLNPSAVKNFIPLSVGLL